MTKKICPLPLPDSGDILMPYTYPVYHDRGKHFYVDFYCFDPASQKMRRKKYYLDKITDKKERYTYAHTLICTLAKHLREGWNPWVNLVTLRGYIPLSDVLDRYLESVAKMGRKKTVFSYSSRVNVFREFLKLVPTKVNVCNFNRQLVTDFLDWLYLDRDVSARTYNNYKGWLGTLGEYLVTRKYLDSNPASGLPKKKEDEKKRKPLTPEMLRALYKHLKEHDRYFLLAVMLEYYTFIRPSELVGMKLIYFRLADQKVFVPGRISKNGKDDWVGLNRRIIELMIDLRVFSNPDQFYLFSKDMRPGTEQQHPDIFNKRWRQIRKRLQWGDEYQFYSLKDSGIRDLANNAGIVIARDQARHSDVSTTNKYLGADQNVREETKVFDGELM